jgi:hypothetical protein
MDEMGNHWLLYLLSMRGAGVPPGAGANAQNEIAMYKCGCRCAKSNGDV